MGEGVGAGVGGGVGEGVGVGGGVGWGRGAGGSGGGGGAGVGGLGEGDHFWHSYLDCAGHFALSGSVESDQAILVRGHWVLS